MQSYHNIRLCHNTFSDRVHSWTRLGHAFYIGREPKAVYECKCGRVFVQFVSNIERGRSRQCHRCVTKPVRHGKSRTRVHNIWCGILTRCDNPKFWAYNNYGGRGITICERWRVFENFYADMGDPPRGYSIERVDCNGNYCPENCIWVTTKQQQLNKRCTRRFNYKGQLLTCYEMSNITGIKSKLIYDRITNKGWGAERAADTPSARTANAKQ